MKAQNLKYETWGEENFKVYCDELGFNQNNAQFAEQN